MTHQLLRQHRRDDYITKMTNVSAAESMPIPQFLSFLDQVTAGDRGLQGFLQRWFGYCLTGITTEHKFVFFYGTGSNGKTTLLNLIAWIMGDYAVRAPMTAFLDSGRHERHPTELAFLRGARLVIMTEIDAGQFWSEAKLKAVTGGEAITARYMRQDFFTFMPQFKLVVAGNNRPSLRHIDEAMRRRLLLVPFTVTIPEKDRDKDLLERLKAEGPGILSWLMEGCELWRRYGLDVPQSVVNASDEYLASEDMTQQWLNECCELGPDKWARASDLWVSYAHWSKSTGSERSGTAAHSLKALMQDLEARGFLSDREGGTGRMIRRGLTLRPEAAQMVGTVFGVAGGNPLD